MKPITLIFIMMMSLLACVYEPGGLYEAEVDKVTEPPADIVVNLNFATDTLLIPASGNTSIVYSTPDALISMALFSINQKTIGKIESTSGVFQINISNQGFATNVPYNLRVELFRRSNSGSLADKMGAEGFLFYKDITIYFVDREKLTPQIKRAYAGEGKMHVEWETYKGVGFNSYHVFNTDFRKIAIISDQFQTSCTDESQIGFGGVYYVVTSTESDSYRSTYHIYKDTLPSASVTRINGSEYLLNWGKSKYENNLKGYRIYEYLPEPNRLTLLDFITDVSRQDYTFRDPHFPMKTRFYIQPVSKYDDIPVNDPSDLNTLASTTTDIFHGDLLPRMIYMFFENPMGDYCYYGNFEHLYQFNAHTDAMTDSIPYGAGQYSVSPDGKTIILGSQRSIQMYNAPDLTLAKTIAHDKLPENDSPMQFVIGDSGIGVALFTSANYYFYDFANNMTLARFRVDYDSSWPAYMSISPSGKFFAMSHYTGNNFHRVTELYQLSGDTVIKAWQGNASYFDFDPQENNFVYFIDGAIKSISLDDLHQTTQLQVQDKYFLHIDWNRREYLSLNEAKDNFSVCDLATGEVKTEVKTMLYYQPDYFFLFNKTLFSNYGLETYKLKLDY